MSWHEVTPSPSPCRRSSRGQAAAGIFACCPILSTEPPSRPCCRRIPEAAAKGAGITGSGTGFSPRATRVLVMRTGMPDLDDVEELVARDVDGLLQSVARAGAQVRAVAEAVCEGVLSPLSEPDRAAS